MLMVSIQTDDDRIDRVSEEVGAAFGYQLSLVRGRRAEGRETRCATMGPLTLTVQRVAPGDIIFRCSPTMGVRFSPDIFVRGDGYFLPLLNERTSFHWYKMTRAEALEEAGLPPNMIRSPEPGPPKPRMASFEVRVLGTTGLEAAARRLEGALGTSVSRIEGVWSARILGVDAMLRESDGAVFVSGSSAPYGEPMDLCAVVESLLSFSPAS